MPKTLSIEECQAAKDLINQGKSVKEAAKILKITPSTISYRLDKLESNSTDTPSPTIEYPDFPDDDIPVEEIIELQKKRFAKRYENYQAKKLSILLLQ